ncbi:hypothetical protein ANN_22924 [Periplaneta americana]|uniref:Regulatory protein zeste n=1 Tax=Periplaneta americana TaxID=6978 RepID=A0ABQ8SJN8_PERAM|nr:hypothetical protein ANN_22924 [Periplaneta americana]
MDGSKRAKNFTTFERNLLVDLVLERKDILESKKTDGTTIAERKRSWEDLCNVFNTSSQTGIRTAKQLKELNFVMKKNARKHNNEDRVGIIGFLQTGGGIHDPKSDTIDAKIVSSLKANLIQMRTNTTPVLLCSVMYQ